MKHDETTSEGVEGAGSPPTPEGQIAAASPRWLPRPLTLIFAIFALVLAALLSIFLLTSEKPTSGTATGSGMPRIGGPFELVNHEGRTVTEADFAGKYMLVYFGYTYCPDVCPTSLNVMTVALESLGEKGRNVLPVFVTIDPERDTPEELAAYVDHFHDRMVGLTGSPEQIRKAATAFRVYYKKAPGGDGTNYLMDHSDIILLMGPDGKYAAHFNRTTSPEEMAGGIARVLNEQVR